MPMIANDYANINARLREIETQRRRALGRLPDETEAGSNSFETIWNFPPAYSEGLFDGGFPAIFIDVDDDDDDVVPTGTGPGPAAAASTDDDDDATDSGDDEDYFGYLSDTGFM